MVGQPLGRDLPPAQKRGKEFTAEGVVLLLNPFCPVVK